MNKNNIRRISRFRKVFPIRRNEGSDHCRYQRVIILYHGISRVRQFNCVVENLFRDQILWIKEKYFLVPLHELVESLKFPAKYQCNLASITFDDGYVNFAESALSILEKYNCHSTVFVPSGKVGHYNDWDEGFTGYKKMPIMTYEHLRQLPQRTVEVGSHGTSHRRFDRLPVSEIGREIVESRLAIEGGVGRPVRFFAYPFGIYPFKVLSSYYGNGDKLLSPCLAACTTWWGRYNSPEDIFTLRRIGIWDSDSFEDFVDKLEGNYDWLAAKEKIGRFYKFITSRLYFTWR